MNQGTFLHPKDLQYAMQFSMYTEFFRDDHIRAEQPNRQSSEEQETGERKYVPCDRCMQYRCNDKPIQGGDVWLSNLLVLFVCNTHGSDDLDVPFH